MLHCSINISNAGKKYDRHWIFRGVNLDLMSGETLAVTGGNGSGKSTFLKMISGYLKPSEGMVSVNIDGKDIPQEKHFNQVAICAPYMQLLEDLTLADTIKQHERFMPWHQGVNSTKVASLCILEGNENKAIKYFSSGMKQRLKLGLALFSSRPIVLLDEPSSNLDALGLKWYTENLEKYGNNRSVVICTNDMGRDVPRQDHILPIEDYKKS